MKKMMKEMSVSNIWHYIIGNFRYSVYYGGTLSRKFAFIAWLRKKVIRKHIKEQIDFRIKVMDKECYNNGECKLCGCQTTALQMAAKSCDKPCYPPLMNKHNWKWFAEFAKPAITKTHIFFYDVKKNTYQIQKIEK